MRLFLLASALAYGCIAHPAAAERSFVARHTPGGQIDASLSGGRVFGTAGVSHSYRDVIALPGGSLIACGLVSTGPLGAQILVSRHLPNGALDPTFGVSGVSTADLPNSAQEVATACTVDDHGRIIVASPATAGTAFLLVRLQPNGTLDSTFGIGGFSLTQFTYRVGNVTYSFHAEPAEVLVTEDAKIVVMGTAEGKTTIVRYNAAGVRDASFGGGDGIAQADLHGSPRFAAIDRFNRINVAADSMGSQAEVGVARFTSNGDLDGAFSGDGKLSVRLFDLDSEPFSDSTYAGGIAIDDDDRLLVGAVRSGLGNTIRPSSVHVARLTPAGALDTSFSGDGRASFVINASPTPGTDMRPAGLGLDSSGRIVIAAAESTPTTSWDLSGPAIVRFLPNGNPDASHGLIHYYDAAHMLIPRALVLDDADRAVVVGSALEATW